MLRFRLATGLTLIIAFLAILGFDEWLAPWFPFWFLTCFVVITVASLELGRMLQATSLAPSTGAIVGGCWAILAANWAPHLLEWSTGQDSFEPFRPWVVMAWPAWTLTLVVMAGFVCQAIEFREPGRSVPKLAGAIFGLVYIGVLGSFLIQFRWLEGKHHGLIPLLMLVATAKGSDTGAYTIGRLFGKNKLWPALSPNKTIEGALGGVLFGVGFAALVAYIGARFLNDFTFSWVRTIGFGLVVSLVAQLGDLMESLIKRDCETKDASHSLPGFGGILDVIDSVLFSAPVAYAYWLMFWP